MLRSPSAVIAPTKYTHSIVCLYTWPAALIVKDTFPPPLIYRHIISFLASETVSQNDEHAVTITGITLPGPSDDRDTMPASSAYSIPHNICTSSPSSPLRRRLCLCVKCPFSRLFVGAAPCDTWYKLVSKSQIIPVLQDWKSCYFGLRNHQIR